jgi:hypothetical protein
MFLRDRKAKKRPRQASEDEFMIPDITAGVFSAALAALCDIKEKNLARLAKNESTGQQMIVEIPEEKLHADLAGFVSQSWCKSRVSIDINTSYSSTGQSILFFAAALSLRGDHRLLSKIIRHWDGLNPDVNNAGQEGDNRGVTVLWYATRLAEFGEGLLLSKILRTWKHLSPDPDIHACPIAGPHAGKSLYDQAVTLKRAWPRFFAKFDAVMAVHPAALAGLEPGPFDSSLEP